MSNIFLNKDTVDSIIENYSTKKFTYHELLLRLIDKSREKLTDTINLYSADLNTIFRKGPPGKGKKVIFKWLQASKGQNNESEEKTPEGADPKAGGFLSSISDEDCCYKILSLHNTKISKILKTSYEAHEDRKNGVIRIPTPAKTTKPTKGKGKKKKKKKVNNNIEFTMVVKSEDQKVEEIPVKVQDIAILLAFNLVVFLL